MVVVRVSSLDHQPLAVPPALKPGDGISIVAPASSPKRGKLEAALATLAGLGYRPKVYRDLCDPQRYLSGSDADRVAELEKAFRDSKTKMVLAARGGYGCGRIVDRVDFELLKQRPKIVCGYSDLTALHAAIQRRCGLVSFHGPNLVDGLGNGSQETAHELSATISLLSGKAGVGSVIAGRSQTATPLVGGLAEGPLVGGNLAVLTSLLGTPEEPDFHDAILVLEDTHEPPYRIDRLLTQLRQSGRLGHLTGIALGYFSDTGEEDPGALHEVFRDLFVPLGIPVLEGLPVGHLHPNYPLPLGARVRLDAEAGTIKLAEPVVAID